MTATKGLPTQVWIVTNPRGEWLPSPATSTHEVFSTEADATLELSLFIYHYGAAKVRRMELEEPKQ